MSSLRVFLGSSLRSAFKRSGGVRLGMSNFGVVSASSSSAFSNRFQSSNFGTFTPEGNSQQEGDARIRSIPTRSEVRIADCLRTVFTGANPNNVALSSSSPLSPLQSTLFSALHQPLPLVTATRNITKFSMRKGRRKTAKCVIKRFYRLDWGGWISPRPGRHHRLWKKTVQERQRLRNHQIRHATECRLLDKMVCKYWIKKKWFVNDPYESYHTRDNFWITKGVNGVKSVNLYKNLRFPMHPPKPYIK